MKSSFTLIEIVLVLIIASIMLSYISFRNSIDKFSVEVDRIISDIRLTQSLALSDDKYLPIEYGDDKNRTKYWFKQFWQIRFFANSNNEYFYEIFSDSPNFDKVGGPVSEFAKSPLTKKYLTGNYNSDNSEDLNLTKFNINAIEVDGNLITSKKSFRLIFDNYGNIFLNEGKKGDAGDINPLDITNREILVNEKIIKFCKSKDDCNSKDKRKCLAVHISVSGAIYKSFCN